MHDCSSLLVFSESTDNVTERQKPTVDMDALFEPVSLGARALDTLATGKVNEVEIVYTRK